MQKKVIFAGVGPGAVDLITIRAREAIAKADVIIYAGSLVNRELLAYAKESAEKYNSADMSLDEVIAVSRDAVAADKQVLRLHTGDPAVYGAIAEQMRELDALNIAYEVIPGVSSAFAAAAELQLEMTLPGITQTAIFTRKAGRTPVPEAETLKKLAANNATLAIFLSVSDMDGLVEELLEAGRAPDCPATVVYRASWPNQKIVRGTLQDIAGKVKEAGISRQAMIITGEALRGQGDKSLLYSDSFAHGYRNPELHAFKGRIAVYALTGNGARKAAEIAEGLNAETLFIPDKAASDISWATAYSSGKFGETLTGNWKNYDAHIFVMACGIVVRHIAPLLADKLSDPAVVVCDENGGNCISLLSGHVGGANRLARIVAGITGGNPVVTTATDVNKLTAFDELAALYGWQIVNRENIKVLNSLLLENKKIDMLVPQVVFEKYFASVGHLNLIKSPEQISAEGAVLLDCQAPGIQVPCLILKSKSLSVGIGCRRNTPCKDIEDAVKNCLENLGMDISNIKCLASLDAKKDEKGLLEFAEKHDLKIKFYPASELNAVECPGYSPRAAKEFGTGSVSEAAALLSSGSDLLLLEKRKFPQVTVAAASYIKDILNNE